MKLKVCIVVCLFFFCLFVCFKLSPFIQSFEETQLYQNVICTPIYSRNIKIYKTVIYILFMDVNLFPHIRGLLQNAPKEDI